MNKLLVIDHSALLWRSVHAYKDLSHEEVPTGGLYGYMIGLNTAIRQNKPTHLVICFDSPPYQRELDYPNYKGDRAPSDMLEHFRAAFYQVHKVIKLLNLPTLKIIHAESDDLMACLALERIKMGFNYVTLFTKDSDLYQCLDEHVTLYKENNTWYTITDFELAYKLHPQTEWPLYIAIAGSHNGVPGIPKYGPVRTLVALKNPNKMSPLKREFGQIIQRNLKLATLPYNDTWRTIVRSTTIPRLLVSMANKRKLAHYLATWAINSTPLLTGWLNDADYHE